MRHLARHLARTVAISAVVAGLATSGPAAAMGVVTGVPGPGVAVTVPPLDPAVGNHVGSPANGAYCATAARNCMLHNAGYVGGPCSCRIHGGRARGHITTQ
jgi:hypothetical protein